MLFEGFFNPKVQPKQPSMPQIKTALTQKAIINMMQGIFTEIPVKKLSLKANEKCIFCDYGILITETLKVVGGDRRGGGFSFRICRGVTYHTGNGANATIRDKVQDYDEGKLYITNKRVIFFSDNKSF